MKTTSAGIQALLSMLTIMCLTASGTAAAKGYSPPRHAPIAESQEVERRLSRVEDQQRKLEDAVAAELRKFRAELSDTKAQNVVKTSVDAPQ